MKYILSIILNFTVVFIVSAQVNDTTRYNISNGIIVPQHLCSGDSVYIYFDSQRAGTGGISTIDTYYKWLNPNDCNPYNAVLDFTQNNNSLTWQVTGGTFRKDPNNPLAIYAKFNSSGSASVSLSAHFGQFFPANNCQAGRTYIYSFSGISSRIIVIPKPNNFTITANKSSVTTPEPVIITSSGCPNTLLLENLPSNSTIQWSFGCSGGDPTNIGVYNTPNTFSFPFTPGHPFYGIGVNYVFAKCNDNGCVSDDYSRATFSVYNDNVEITGNGNKPIIETEEIDHPNYSDNSKTLKLNIKNCPTGQINWLKGGQQGRREIIIINPYECNEYQVSCVSSCGNTSNSDIYIPAKNFHPKNGGYSSVFTNYVNQKFNESMDKADFAYRQQYNCILNNSINQPWGQNFVKSSFNYVAQNRNCEKTFESSINDYLPLLNSNLYIRALNSFAVKFTRLGLNHELLELVPSFGGSLFQQNSCSNISSIRNEHEQFLQNAVVNCFDTNINSPNYNSAEKIILKTGKIFTLFSVRFMRESLINNLCGFGPLTKSVNNTSNSKSDLFISELDSISTIKVTAIVDTTYYLSTKETYQLKVLKYLPNGDIIDLTSSSSGTEYRITLDSSIASVSAEGLLLIKKSFFPYISINTPLIVIATNGNDIGFGQFAIKDSDVDTDNLADTFEDKVGLNSNINNASNSDLDLDGISDFFELGINTSPVKFDTDNDGYSDKIEILAGSDANNPNSIPTQIYSIKNGLWTNSDTWSCDCIPTRNDPVKIKSGHVININPSMGLQECLKIDVEQGSIFNCTGLFKTTIR
jgi:hypothetical protein